MAVRPPSVVQVVRKLVAPLQRRVNLMVSRAVVSLVDDALRMQGLQVKLLADEVRDGVEHFQPYGFTSVPEPGAEGVFLSIGGDRSHGVVVVVDDRRYRPTGLEEGEVALYTKQGGIRLRFKADGTIEAGTGPTDFVALASPTDAAFADLQEHFSALESVLTGTAINEPGNGAPSALQVALKAAITSTPYPAPQSVAAEEFKAK